MASDGSPLMGLIRSSSMQLPFDIHDFSNPIFQLDAEKPQNTTITEASQVLASSSSFDPCYREQGVV
jgi:hypothetical protein